MIDTERDCKDSSKPESKNDWAETLYEVYSRIA